LLIVLTVLVAEMLKGLFEQLQNTTEASAQPSQKLANTALSSAKEILSEPVTQKPPPLPARPSPAPPVPAKTEDNKTNVTVETISDRLETASSHSSMTLVEETEGNGLSTVETKRDDGKPIENQTVPGPVPQSGDKVADDVEMQDATKPLFLEEKVAKVSERLERSDRSGTAQQDVEEIIGNILEHLMRAIRPDGPMDGKSELQADRITKTFFTIIVNWTIKTSPDGSGASTASSVEENVHNTEVIPERWITAFPHPDTKNKVRITLYAALDRYFGYELLSGGQLARYTTIRSLPPIFHICIQRTDASGVKNRNPVIIPESMYLDRYMESRSGSRLWNVRRRVWAIKERLKELESRSVNDPQNVIQQSVTDSFGRNVPEAQSFDDAFLDTSTDNDFEAILENPLLQDLPRGSKRTKSVASHIGVNDIAVRKRRSTAEQPTTEDASLNKFADFLCESTKDIYSMTSEELQNLRKEEEHAFEEMQEEKYSLHAVICHGGGMSAGHYWVSGIRLNIGCCDGGSADP
jgi:ubiquitin carboxyl-terminal hydrolase 25